MTTSELPRAEIVDLSLDDLAFRILQHLVENPAFASRSYVTSIYTWRPIELGLSWNEVGPRATAAWELLLWFDLLARDQTSDDSAGTATITDRGREVVERDSDLGRVRAETRIEMGLHPLLDDVSVRFLRGDYEAAVLFAMRQVEIHVRQRADLAAADFGSKLMRKAFDPEDGPLADPALVPAEREANAHLFAGAIGLLKNPSSHREVGFDDPTIASEVVLFADLLLRLVDIYARRAAANNLFLEQEYGTPGEGYEDVSFDILREEST
jgi:uncharacterized protein (TIGR02391 family)